MKKNQGFWLWGIPLIFIILLIISYWLGKLGWLLVIYLFFNLFSFTIFGYDKRKAKRERWRTPERLFFIWGFFGGAIGILIGMRIFHHKTLHPLFKYGIPLLVLENIVILILIINYYYSNF